MGIFFPCCDCLRHPADIPTGISERDDRTALAEIIDAVDPDAAAVVRDEDLFTPRGAPPCGMGVCDKKIPVHVVDRPVVPLGQFPKQSVDPLWRQHRFSPAEEKPAVLEAEEDESHRDADPRGPEKRAGRDRHHTREGDDDHEERKIEEHDWKQIMGPDPFGVERQPAVSPNEAGRIDPGFVAASNPNEYFNEEQTTDSRHP